MAHGGWYNQLLNVWKNGGILIQIIKSTTELKKINLHSGRFYFCSASFFVKTDKRAEDTPEN
jgi:hypothetical protein